MRPNQGYSIANCSPVFQEYVSKLQFWMESGASLDIRDTSGKTALGWAIELGHSEIAEALRAAGD